MRDKIIEILMDISEDYDPNEDLNLIEDGVLDSFDIVSFIIELNEAFGIRIEVQDVVPENFESVDTVLDLVKKVAQGR